MAKIFTFTLAAGAHSWYEDATTGAIVQAVDGTVVSTHSIVHVDDYVAAGLGSISGSDVSTDALYFGCADGMRTIVRALGLSLDGPAELWTFDAMFDLLNNTVATDQEAIDAYIP